MFFRKGEGEGRKVDYVIWYDLLGVRIIFRFLKYFFIFFVRFLLEIYCFGLISNFIKNVDILGKVNVVSLIISFLYFWDKFFG